MAERRTWPALVLVPAMAAGCVSMPRARPAARITPVVLRDGPPTEPAQMPSAYLDREIYLAQLPAKAPSPETAVAVEGLSRPLDTVLDRLDALVEESLVVQQSLLRLRFGAAPEATEASTAVQ